MNKMRNKNRIESTFSDYQMRIIESESKRMGIGKATYVKWKVFGNGQRVTQLQKKGKNKDLIIRKSTGEPMPFCMICNINQVDYLAGEELDIVDNTCKSCYDKKYN